MSAHTDLHGVWEQEDAIDSHFLLNLVEDTLNWAQHQEYCAPADLNSLRLLFLACIQHIPALCYL